MSLNRALWDALLPKVFSDISSHNLALDFEPWVEMNYLRDIHLITKTVKPMEMSTTDMRLITKGPKHLIEKERMDHVHQKNHVVK